MLRAREVIEDAQTAFELLEEQIDETMVRIHWFLCICLCRTALDALNKVDRKHSENTDAAISEQWKNIKDHPTENEIFFHFIKAERDLMIHQYEVSADSYEAPLLAFDEDGSIAQVANEIGLEGDFDWFILQTGKYAGEDARDILKEALSWVDSRVTEIEKSLLEGV
ncbi:MAG: hypothetical protein AAFP80_02725 [Pseudomonadota bacterium]